MIDCGEGTQMQLRRFRIRFTKIQHIFISHLHGDHYLGLTGLMFTMHLLGRTLPLHVYANPDLKRIIDLQLEVSDTTLLYPLIFHPLEPGSSGVIFKSQYVEVTAFPLQHRVPTHGFVFREKSQGLKIDKKAIEGIKLNPESYTKLKEGKDVVIEGGNKITAAQVTIPSAPLKAYAYCSDTGYTDSYLPFIMGVDLLYHEATFMADKTENAREKEHSTTVDAAQVAIKAGVKRLVVGHYSARYDELQPVIDEVRAVFPNSELAEEGNTIIV